MERKNKNDLINSNPQPPEVVRRYNNFDQYGRTGVKKYAGVFYEEFIDDLSGRKGIETYREMSMNDDVIGSILFAIEMLIRQVDWPVNPGGNTETDQKAADFVKECMDDMAINWQDTISDILSFMVYGWSYHEICYKIRNGKQKRNSLSSKYDDGLIGWQKLPIRSQDTLYRWEYDEYDELVGMSQMAPPDYHVLTIPYEKSLHFMTKNVKGSPEGRSILRSAYRSWYFKKRFQEIEGIGVERDLAGLPFIQAPDGVNLWDTDDPEMIAALNVAETLVQNIRRDEKEGIVLPFGWELKLLTGGSARQFEIGTIIERYDNRMASTVMADFILLGQQSVGSFALADSKTKLFAKAISTYLDIICNVFNSQGIPRLIDLNAEHFNGITDYPVLDHGDIDKKDVKEFIEALEKVVGMGIITPDEGIENVVRDTLGLPERIEEAEYPETTETANSNNVKPEAHKQETDVTDEEQARELAKSILGRK